MYLGRRPIEEWLEDIGWYADKICVCPNDSGLYHHGYDWEHMYHYTKPPFCITCSKWMNRMHKCAQCGDFFYEFFNHPRSGYHSEPKRGWYCLNCLEKYMPPVVMVRNNRPKTPPPALVLPPGYELYKVPELL